MVEGLVMDHNLSIMAFDAETNAPVGVMLNGVFHREELEMSRSEVFSQYHIHPSHQSFFLIG